MLMLLRLALVASTILPMLAYACSPAQPYWIDPDPSLAKANEQPPPAPSVTLLSVSRGSDTDPLDSCGDTGTIVLGIPVSDATRELLFTFEQISGFAGDAIFQKGTMRGVEVKGQFLFIFPWLDGASAKQEPIDLRVRVTAFLPSGLRGGYVDVHVRDPGR